MHAAELEQKKVEGTKRKRMKSRELAGGKKLHAVYFL
jgi:hypothetical protein